MEEPVSKRPRRTITQCLKKLTTTIRSSTGAGNSSTDEYGQQQQMLKEISFFPREEANMPYDFKVSAWLDLLFTPVDAGTAPALNQFFPGTASDTTDEEDEEESIGTIGCTGNKDGEFDQVAREQREQREQREWRASTRASIDRYRRESEPKLKVQTACRLPPAWREHKNCWPKQAAQDLVHSQTEPHRLHSNAFHQPQQQQHEYQMYRQRSQSPYLQVPQQQIVPAVKNEYYDYRQNLMQIGNRSIYYSTELNVPLKRSRFGSLDAIDPYH